MKRLFSFLFITFFSLSTFHRKALPTEFSFIKKLSKNNPSFFSGKILKTEYNLFKKQDLPFASSCLAISSFFLKERLYSQKNRTVLSNALEKEDFGNKGALKGWDHFSSNWNNGNKRTLKGWDHFFLKNLKSEGDWFNFFPKVMRSLGYCIFVSDLGKNIGEGGYKSVYKIKSSKNVIALLPADKPNYILEREVALLKKIESYGVRTVKERRLCYLFQDSDSSKDTKIFKKILGQDFVRIEGRNFRNRGLILEYVEGGINTKNIFLLNEKKFFVSEKTMEDFGEYIKIAKKHNFYIKDLQFLLKPDGSLILIDPLDCIKYYSSSRCQIISEEGKILFYLAVPYLKNTPSASPRFIESFKENFEILFKEPLLASPFSNIDYMENLIENHRIIYKDESFNLYDIYHKLKLSGISPVLDNYIVENRENLLEESTLCSADIKKNFAKYAPHSSSQSKVLNFSFKGRGNPSPLPPEKQIPRKSFSTFPFKPIVASQNRLSPILQSRRGPLNTKDSFLASFRIQKIFTPRLKEVPVKSFESPFIQSLKKIEFKNIASKSRILRGSLILLGGFAIYKNVDHLKKNA